MLPIWLRDISARRKRYSRDAFGEASYLKNLSLLINTLFRFTEKESYTHVVDDATRKFRSRISAYLPEIQLEEYIHACPDFPKPGIFFRDIAPLLSEPEALRYACFEVSKTGKGCRYYSLTRCTRIYLWKYGGSYSRETICYDS